ncbi:hypothetical protein OAO55_00080 [Bacteroidales bacterium]|nr:hypothetical protein [Bacteroidales bacterium]
MKFSVKVHAVCFFAVINILTNTIFAQDLPQLKFEKLNTEHGLSNNMTKFIVQDSTGFLWIGTNGGTNRYDGYGFKIYTSDKRNPYSIHSNIVADMCLDNHNNMWFATNGGGIEFYNAQTDRFINFVHDPNDSTSPPSNFNSRIILDHKNNLWVSTKDGLVYANIDEFYQDSTLSFKFVTFLDRKSKKRLPLIKSSVNLLCDKRGHVWVRSNKALYVFEDPETLFDFPVQKMGGGPIINVDDKVLFWSKNLMMASYDLNDKINLTRYHSRNMFNNKSQYIGNVNSLAIDKNKQIWIGTGNDGLYTARFHPKMKEILVNSHSTYDLYFQEGISARRVSANGILVDRTNNIWILTADKGLNKYNGEQKQFKHIHMSNKQGSPNFMSIRSFNEDDDGNLWIGGAAQGDYAIIPDSLNNGMYNTFINNGPKNTLFTGDKPTAMVYSIADVKSDRYPGTFFFSWGGGINYVSPEQPESGKIHFSKYVNKKMPQAVVLHMFADRDKHLWYGRYNGGLTQILLNESGDVDTVYAYLKIPGDSTSLPSNIVRYTYQTNDGTLWVGTAEGFSKIIRSGPNDFDLKFKTYKNIEGDTNSISYNYVLTMYEDKKGNFWIGTYGGGLNKFNRSEDTFKAYTVYDGIAHNMIKGIVEDDHGNLWISTGKGLSKFNPETEKFRNYTKADGLQDNDFLDLSYLKRKNGELLFGGVNGFNAFYPDSIKDNPFKPNVIISNFKINHKNAVIGKKYSRFVNLPQAISLTHEINVNYKEQVLDFEFSSDHYALPNYNKFRYKLDPVEKEWTETDAQKRYATFSNLKGGKYTLMVQASNSDQIWGPLKTIAIHVYPPFWKTLAFRIAALVLIIYGTFRFIKYREKTAKKQKELLENKIKESEDLVATKMAEVEKQEEILKQRDIDEHDMRYINRGLAKFGDIISINKESVEQLCKALIAELADYLEVQQAIIFITDILPEDKNIEILKIKASFACDKERLTQDYFHINEGIVGACFLENKIQTITNLPDNYTLVNSGLGKMPPKYLIAVPIMLHDIKEGVIEITSFKEIEKHKIDFLIKFCESFASTINALKQNEKIQVILSKSQEDTEGLRAQEEELRQNIEELQATQEEMKRKEDQLRKISGKLKQQEKVMQDKIDKLRSE